MSTSAGVYPSIHGSFDFRLKLFSVLSSISRNAILLESNFSCKSLASANAGGLIAGIAWQFIFAVMYQLRRIPVLFVVLVVVFQQEPR